MNVYYSNNTNFREIFRDALENNYGTGTNSNSTLHLEKEQSHQRISQTIDLKKQVGVSTGLKVRVRSGFQDRPPLHIQTNCNHINPTQNQKLIIKFKPSPPIHRKTDPQRRDIII